MLAIGLIIGLIGGYVIRARGEESCPRAILGYNCLGSDCDHRKSEQYRSKMAMALNDEKYGDGK